MPLNFGYDRGSLDLKFQAYYGIPYPIKGVMHYTQLEALKRGLAKDILNLLFRDVNGEYYYWQWQRTGSNSPTEYLGRFRGQSNMSPEDFVKRFKGVMTRSSKNMPKQDIEEVQRRPGCDVDLEILTYDQEVLWAIFDRFQARHGCSCREGWWSSPG